MTENMQVIPAIDLMKGKVVRLTKGDPNTAKIYEHLGSPVEVALKWKSEGAKRIHIIDLDAAFSRGDNRNVIAEIAKATELPIQVGGGIRSYEAAEKLLATGISHVILGALAFSDPRAITKILKQFGPEHVIVALDNKDGKIMVEGWQTATEYSIAKAMTKFREIDVRNFFITSIAVDGTLQGPDLEILSEASKTPDVDIIAAGGIGGINDLIALKNVGVKGVVVGKALYEGRFDLKEAIEAVNGA
jgi:phosphoribosylformimino-5-aminoimidazole carboxamide ribotide isomerase